MALTVQWPMMELMFLLATFYDAISVVVPQTVDLLKDNDSDVWSNCIGALGQLAKHHMQWC